MVVCLWWVEGVDLADPVGVEKGQQRCERLLVEMLILIRSEQLLVEIVHASAHSEIGGIGACVLDFAFLAISVSVGVEVMQEWGTPRIVAVVGFTLSLNNIASPYQYGL